jgi:hypothetical protein
VSIFVKCILKDIVCGIADTVKNFKSKEEIHNEKVYGIEPTEKSLMWKLNNYKRENLISLIELGHKQSASMGKDEIPKPIHRPIFDNLYNFKYRWDP